MSTRISIGFVAMLLATCCPCLAAESHSASPQSAEDRWQFGLGVGAGVGRGFPTARLDADEGWVDAHEGKAGPSIHFLAGLRASHRWWVDVGSSIWLRYPGPNRTEILGSPHPEIQLYTFHFGATYKRERNGWYGSGDLTWSLYRHHIDVYDVPGQGFDADPRESGPGVRLAAGLEWRPSDRLGFAPELSFQWLHLGAMNMVHELGPDRVLRTISTNVDIYLVHFEVGFRWYRPRS